MHKCKQFTPKDNALVKCMTIMTIFGIATYIGNSYIHWRIATYVTLC